MKATKKIVGAACALVAAVALSAGSTFAWFSSNGTVTATGMKIDVATSNTYLIIADTAANLSKNATTMTLEGSTTDIMPSAYEETATVTTGDTCITKPSQWYTAQGVSSTDGTLKDGTKTQLNDESVTFSNYVVEEEIYISVAEGANEVQDVKMSFIDTSVWTAKNDALSIVILYRKLDNSAEAETATTAWTKSEVNADGEHVLDTAGTLTLPGVKYGEYIQIHLMVYFDGAHEDVYTKNSANLEGVTFGFNFVAGASVVDGTGD